MFVTRIANSLAVKQGYLCFFTVAMNELRMDNSKFSQSKYFYFQNKSLTSQMDKR